MGTDARDLVILVLLAVVIWQLAKSNPTLLSNNETVEWTDYRGEKMVVSTSRSLHESKA